MSPMQASKRLLACFVWKGYEVVSGQTSASKRRNQRSSNLNTALGVALVGHPVTTICSLEMDVTTTNKLRLAVNLAKLAIEMGLIRTACVYMPDKVLEFTAPDRVYVS